ncbi:hypothetical protein [Roseibium suaedae]|uniref:PLL-like beta propeller domain-containing protein n=1 Tax=Roseibium suaedae TaxID=735517 RepID=A0A1M7KHH0_9HYPH|nr:hypothetical protein [Roseibium suaedae]SHM64553.1 hypothetical protein SAMN05444272_2839 [Roseibium suaedae]
MQSNVEMSGELPQEAASETAYFRIFVAATNTSGTLGYFDQTIENGPFSNSFTPLTGDAYVPSTLRAGTTMNGYVALLAEDNATGHLSFIREEAEGTDRFEVPLDLGLPSAGPCKSTAMIRGLDGMINVFAVCADQTIWWKYQNTYSIREETITTTPPGTDTPIEVKVPVRVPPEKAWSDWQQLPGALVSISAIHNADGRIFLVGLNADQVPYLNMQTSDHPQLPEHWAGWEDLSGGLTGFEQITAGISGNALVHIFARIGSKVYQRVQTEVDGSEFTGWVLFASFSDTVSTLALGPAMNTGLYLAALVGNAVYGSNEIMDGSGNWSQPAIIAHVDGPSVLGLWPNANRQLSLFALNPASSTLSYVTQLFADRWSATWLPVGAGLTSFSLTSDVTPNT